jgi:ribA/ribD-fused uncharacterized protein
MTVEPGSVRSVAQLIEAAQGGERIKYVFFWGHAPAADGSVTSACFSQWWPVKFTVDGHDYRSAEHFMMAGKALLFGDPEMAERIRAVEHPAEAKKLGRLVSGFDEDTWKDARFEIVVQASVAKFGQHSELRDYLLATGERVLVEASPRDRIWGIGMGAKNADAEAPELWRGQNLLGFALMEARERLRKVAAAA